MDGDFRSAPGLHQPGHASDSVPERQGFLARNRRFLWLALVVVLVGLGVWALTPHGPQTRAGRYGSIGPTPVGVAVAQAGDVHVERDGLGTVTPLATVSVRPQVSGPIVKINFKEGQAVKAGEVLAEIDPRPYQAVLDQAKGQLARDEAVSANARLDLARYQALAKANAVSQQQLATQAATVKQDEAIVLADKASVETANLNLGYTEIKAPVGGLVGLRQVDLGNLVTAGQSGAIAVITQMQPMSVLFTVPEDAIDAIRAQAQRGETLTADAYDRSNTDKIATGRLASIDNQVDPATGTVKLRALFENGDGQLFPNAFVNIHLRVQTLHDQTSVPGAAIQQGAQGTYVFIVNPDKTVSLRAVTVGVADGANVQIVSGLKPGDTVVIDGADRLSDGAQVSLPDARSLVIARPSAAPAGSPTPVLHGRRGAMSALFRKLTPDEREKLRAMSRDDRMAWLKAHKDALDKRPDQRGGR